MIQIVDRFDCHGSEQVNCDVSNRVRHSMAALSQAVGYPPVPMGGALLPGGHATPSARDDASKTVGNGAIHSGCVSVLCP
jgi:hypothetical protein